MHVDICNPRPRRVASDAGGVTPLKEMWPIVVNVTKPPARSVLDGGESSGAKVGGRDRAKRSSGPVFGNVTLNGAVILARVRWTTARATRRGLTRKEPVLRTARLRLLPLTGLR